MERYNIAYKGLSVGRHNFNFDVDDSLFAAFESEIEHGSARVDIELNRQSTMLELDVTIDGNVRLACDRCLEEFDQSVHYEGTLIVRFSEQEHEDDADIMWLHPSEDMLPLGQYIYESICLSLPYNRVHPVDEDGNSECDPDMLSRFKIEE